MKALTLLSALLCGVPFCGASLDLNLPRLTYKDSAPGARQGIMPEVEQGLSGPGIAYPFIHRLRPADGERGSTRFDLIVIKPTPGTDYKLTIVPADSRIDPGMIFPSGKAPALPGLSPSGPASK